MQKISPHLWFDDQAEEAVKLYTSVFPHSRVIETSRYSEAGAAVAGRPAGSVMTVAFELEGERFTALNGGPVFRFTPAVSFFVSCGTVTEINSLYGKLSEGGKILMEFQKYPFSEKYAWVEDRYGLSWQLNLAKRDRKITPALMFTGKNDGKAEEAMKFYTSVFSGGNGDGSRISTLERYVHGEPGEGMVKFAVFSLHGQEFMAMDSGLEHGFTFTEAVSLLVDCKTQAEVDGYWQNLTEGGEPGPCGWLKDKYGLSWQIVPGQLGEMLTGNDPKKTERVMAALLNMKKIDIAGLKKAYDGT